MKICWNCKCSKPLDAFYDRKTSSGSTVKQAQCKPCNTKYTREWRQKNKEHYREQRKVYRRERNFGVSEEMFTSLLEKQNYVCAICHEPNDGDRELAVDHCHKTEKEEGIIKVRGLLCGRCNRGIGQFEDCQELLNNTIMYLKGETNE